MSIIKKNSAITPSTLKENVSMNPFVNSEKGKRSESPQKKILPPIKNVERKTGPTTRITIKYDVGFSNAIFLRGHGATLAWNKGIPLKNSKHNEWVWETNDPFTTIEFKVLINDKEYEIGDNHLLTCGASIQYTPKFH